MPHPATLTVMSCFQLLVNLISFHEYRRKLYKCVSCWRSDVRKTQTLRRDYWRGVSGAAFSVGERSTGWRGLFLNQIFTLWFDNSWLSAAGLSANWHLWSDHLLLWKHAVTAHLAGSEVRAEVTSCTLCLRGLTSFLEERLTIAVTTWKISLRTHKYICSSLGGAIRAGLKAGGGVRLNLDCLLLCCGDPDCISTQSILAYWIWVRWQ